ncbi:hypothetical protein [Streptomyces albireticuli]|uniref:Uncharacterized protein n=1 Tax=Streptomyces albireticuli TaxID=1940 RepID=A0A2A2D4W3_9ACTN|nr:hypothetical protein [Streptomyces albireticuli]MCD9196055.1 hypothetical protein [Streptomyces albireticuli]PAU46555.1 hypothetical protein CK936_23465 [Streptomyces albireticuli]
MGFFSAIDGFVGDCKAGAQANKFARGVRVGDVWYSVETHAMPWGDVQFVQEHKFTRKCGLTGQAMCGHRTAAHVWLEHDLVKRRPAGIPTLEEYSETGSWHLPGLSEDVAGAHAEEIQAAFRRLRQMIGAR